MAGKAARACSTALVTLALCFVASMCEGMDIQSAGVAASGVRRAMHATPGELGLFFSAANLGVILGALCGGRLADRIGRKPVLIASLAVFGLCSLLTAVAGDMTMLTLARFATGVGLGGAMPNFIALAAAATPERSRNTTIALSYVGMPIGGTIASLIVLRLPHDQWRPLFVIGGLAPLVWSALMALFLREPAPAGKAREAGPISELFTESRLARTLVLWLGVFAAALTLHLMLNWLPLLLQARGLRPTEAAAAQVGFNLLGAAGAFVAGAGLDTRWRAASVAFVIAAVPIALIAVAQGPPTAVVLLAGAGLLGAGAVGLHGVIYGAAGECYPERVRATGMGGVVGASRVGALSGPTLAAVLLAAGHSPTEVLTSLVPVVLTAGASVAWLGWPRRKARVAVATA